MNSEPIKYFSTSFTMKLNNDHDIKKLNDRITFLENRQQGNSKIIGDIRDNICDIYSICELLQQTLNTSNKKIENLTHTVKTLDKQYNNSENRLQRVEDDYRELNEFMQKIVDD